jgi:hypothetical protein
MKSTRQFIILIGICFLLGCAEKESMVLAVTSPLELEVVSQEIGREIKENLNEFSTMKEYPEGFKSIEDVKLDWISIAGFHSRNLKDTHIFKSPQKI